MTPPASSSGYKRIAGRKFLHEATGEVISRRQFDKLSGRIQGSYEAKAKANKLANPSLSQARPARGRTSNLKNSLTNKGRNLKTTSNRKFKDVLIPIYYLAGEPDLNRAGRDYEDFVNGLKDNPRAFGVTTQIVFMKYGEEMVRNLLPTDRWPTLTKLGIALEEFKLSYDYTPEDRLIAFSMHVIFRSEYMKTL